ncbi:hypothetical protein CYMTET_5322, partial [Cymbomonas tetramitiformis]
ATEEQRAKLPHEDTVQYVDCGACSRAGMFNPTCKINKSCTKIVRVIGADSYVVDTHLPWFYRCINEHFSCRPCIDNYMLESFLKFHMRSASITQLVPCPMCVGPEEDKAMETLERWRVFVKNKTVFDKLFNARAEEIIREEGRQEQMRANQIENEQRERAHQEELARLAGNDQVEAREVFDQRANAILSDDPSCKIRTPCCGLPVLEVLGCMSVRCEPANNGGRQEIGCGKYFCAWCFRRAPNSEACHMHLRQCPLNPNRSEPALGAFFTTHERHLAHWASVVARQVLDRINREAEGPLKEAMMRYFESNHRNDYRGE